jgi:hypothetical protein
MKISKSNLRKLIIEAIEEVYVSDNDGLGGGKFVDDKGNVKASLPVVTKYPRAKNPLKDDQLFIDTFKPIMTFSFNMPDFPKKPTHDLTSMEPVRALTTILSSINYRRNKNKKSNVTTAEYVNADFGSSFSPEEVKKIADAIEIYGNFVNGEKVEEIYRNLGGPITSYTPSLKPSEKSGPKTVSMKPPGVFEESSKNKKVKIKCNY